MDPTNTFPTNPNLANSTIHTTNAANYGPLSVQSPAQEIHLFSSPYNSPPQMITPRINPAETLKGISQLHSRLDEMLKSSSKIQSIEQASAVGGVTFPNNVVQREMTRPNSVQVSYRSEVLEKFSQVPMNLSGFPLSPKVETFPTFSGAETPSLLNSAPIYDKNKLEHILANIKTKEVVHPANAQQLYIDPHTGFQGRPQPQVQSVMSPYARPQEFVRPPMDPYAQVPNGHPGFSSPHAFPQNIPHQQQQQQQYGNFYHPAMTQPNQIQSPRQVQSPTVPYVESPYYQAPQMEQQMRAQAQYVENPYYQAPQMEQQMRAPYAEPRGHPQFDPRMYQQVHIPQVYEREIPEEFGELEADEEEYQTQSQPIRQLREPVSQQKSHQGFRSGNKRNLQRRQEEEEQEPEQREEGAFWGQVQNDEDSLIMKHHPAKQESSRKNHRQTNENLFGELEDDSTEYAKPAQKTQSKQKTNKGGRSKRRGARNPENVQRIIPDDIFTEPVIEQGPQVEGKVTGGRPRRNSRKRFPLFKGEEPAQTKTNAMQPTEPVTPSAQVFGQEFRSGGSISKKGSPEKAAQTPKMRESADYQLKERSPYTNNTIQPLTLAELEKGLEISTASEIKKLHQDTLNQFEALSDFVFKGGNTEPESHNDSITKAFEHAKCQSPLKMSPPQRKVKETVAMKTELVFKNNNSRRRLVR